jgi:hypothetical protein
MTEIVKSGPGALQIGIYCQFARDEEGPMTMGIGTMRKLGIIAPQFVTWSEGCENKELFTTPP